MCLCHNVCLWSFVFVCFFYLVYVCVYIRLRLRHKLIEYRSSVVGI